MGGPVGDEETERTIKLALELRNEQIDAMGPALLPESSSIDCDTARYRCGKGKGNSIEASNSCIKDFEHFPLKKSLFDGRPEFPLPPRVRQLGLPMYERRLNCIYSPQLQPNIVIKGVEMMIDAYTYRQTVDPPYSHSFSLTEKRRVIRTRHYSYTQLY